MEQENTNKFKCSGDCLNCRSTNDRKIQWQYCAAQFTYNTMRMIETMQESLNSLSSTVKDLAAKVEAIQNSEAMVFDPTLKIEPDEAVKTEEIAQIGDGAESRNPETNSI